MGYGYYETSRGPAGYGVQDVCHAEGCAEEIDRGLGCLCGDNPHAPDPGCGWWFCAAHLFYADRGETVVGQLCGPCLAKVDEEDEGVDECGICRTPLDARTSELYWGLCPADFEANAPAEDDR